MVNNKLVVIWCLLLLGILWDFFFIIYIIVFEMDRFYWWEKLRFREVKWLVLVYK